MEVPTFLFEDHCESYIHWKSKGLKNLCVIHVDAHLDVSEDGLADDLLEKMKNCRTSFELEQFRRNDDILWGGFHPGNYLYPAIREGIVSKLVWVIPEWLPGRRNLLNWAKEDLQEWIEITLSDYDSLRMKGEKVSGKLLGCEFEICFLKDLKAQGENIAWDIDSDYLIDNNDCASMSPEELVSNLRKKAPNPVIITIAYSVNGGYLPPHQKYLGDLIFKALRGDMTENIRRAHSYIREADKAIARMKTGEIRGANLLARIIEFFRTASMEKSLKPYIDLRLSSIYKDLSEMVIKNGNTNPSQAIQLVEDFSERIPEKLAYDAYVKISEKYLKAVRESDPSLIIRPYDRAMIHYRRKEYKDALKILRETADIDEVHFLLSHFISAVIHIKRKEYNLAISHWETIMNSIYFETWSPAVRAHIYFLAGSTAYRLPDSALPSSTPTPSSLAKSATDKEDLQPFFHSTAKCAPLDTTGEGNKKDLQVSPPMRALDLLNKSIQLNPDYYRAYSLRGQCYLILGDFERAARDFRRYLWKKPDLLNSMEVRLLLAETYRRQGKKGLETMEVQNITRMDTTGFFALKARLGRYV